MNRRIISSIFLIISLFSVFIVPGCVHKRDSLAQAAIANIDSSILRYSGSCNAISEKDVTEYVFRIVTLYSDEVGDQVTNLYNAVNSVLSSEEFYGRKIRVFIETDHSDAGASCVVAYMYNYYPYSSTPYMETEVYDHITSIQVNGIDYLSEGYNFHHRYVLNNANYWDSFTEVESLSYSELVEYETEIINDEQAIEGLEQYMLDRFGDYLSIREDVYVWSERDPYINLDMSISQSDIIQSDEYDSVTSFVDSVRCSLNDYCNLHMDDELFSYRIRVGFHTNGENSTVLASIRNFNSLSRELYVGFLSVDFGYVQVEDIINCDGITEIDMFDRSVEEVEIVLDNVEGIECVNIIDRETSEILSEEYPQVVFR